MKILELTKSVTIVSLLLILYSRAPAFCAVSPEAYVNGIHGFSFNPPSGWIGDESGAYGTVVIFYGPVILETGGKININIAAGTATANLDEYVSGVKQWFALNFTNFNVVSEGHRNVGELDCYELVDTWTYTANVSYTFNVKQKLVLFVEKGKAYNIIFTASPANYDEYLPVFEESLQTFKLLGEEPPWLFIGFLIGGIIVVGITCSAATLHIIQGKRTKARQQKIEREMLDVLKLHKSIKIEDLARRLEAKEADIELAVIQLRKNGVPINFNRETREVIYEK